MRVARGTRALMFQLTALAGADQAFRQDALRWMFATLETGNAAIDLREELAAISARFAAHPRFSADTAWRNASAGTLRSVSALFERPDARRYTAALAATRAAIDASRAVLEHIVQAGAPREERHQLQRILSRLHFIRTALIDPQSPFAAYAGSNGVNPGNPQGTHHAS